MSSPPDQVDRAAAWATFWAGRPGRPRPRCLDGAPEVVEQRLVQRWQQVAGLAPPGAHILDVATGDGVVLATMLAVRPDLYAIGVDRSPSLPQGPPGARLIPGVMMEALPLPGGSIDIITSQFGFEYGDMERAALEMARVAMKNARVALVLHHSGSAIVRQNTDRGAALRWAIDNPIAKARIAIDGGAPPIDMSALAVAARHLPAQQVAADILRTVAMCLEIAPRNYRAADATLTELLSRARQETMRIEDLRMAASDRSAIPDRMLALRHAGLDVADAAILCDRAGEPIAWILDAVRL